MAVFAGMLPAIDSAEFSDFTGAVLSTVRAKQEELEVRNRQHWFLERGMEALPIHVDEAEPGGTRASQDCQSGGAGAG